MHFLWVEMLWLLALVPAFVITYVLVQRGRKKFALRYASLSLVKEALGRGPGFRRHVPPLLFLIGMATMLVALARPMATVTLPSQQGTVILTIDVSGSMRADDLKPDRMEAAKAAAVAFVENQPKNIRIGVVSFTDGASLVQAPTTEREPVIAAINRLTPQRGTAIGRGILTSLDAIFEGAAGTLPPEFLNDAVAPFGVPPPPPPLPPGAYAPAVIVLLSDGQSNVGPPPLEIIKHASNRGVRVYTVGVGSPEGTVLRVGGRSIRVQLDEETLKGIAVETHAEYFKADSEVDLRLIYENLGTQLILKPEETELTAGFTGLAIMFLLAAGMLSLLWFSRVP